MIWILLSIGYVALGYLYSEVVWKAPEVKEVLEEHYAMSPEGSFEGKLAVIKLLIALFWPVFFFVPIGIYALQELGIMKPDDEEEE
jgi:hypothetical protein